MAKIRQAVPLVKVPDSLKSNNCCFELQSNTSTTPVQRFYLCNAHKSQSLEPEKLQSGYYEQVTSPFSHIDRYIFLLTNTFENLTILWDDIQEPAAKWLNEHTHNQNGGYDGIIYKGSDWISENFKELKLFIMEFTRPFAPNTDANTIYWSSQGLDLPGYFWPGGIIYPQELRNKRKNIFKHFRVFLASLNVSAFCFSLFWVLKCRKIFTKPLEVAEISNPLF